MKHCKLFSLIMVLMVGGAAFVGATGTGSEAEAVPFNESGYPIVDETYVMTVATYLTPFARVSDFDELPTVQAFEDKTNVHIDWELSPQTNWEQTLSLMLASRDWPDMVWKGSNSVTVQGGTEGVWHPLQDLIPKYAPVVHEAMEANPQLVTAMTAPDGNIYALSGQNSWHFLSNGAPQGQLLINQTWLGALDLDKPTTIEEYYNVLVAFRDGDPNNNGEADEVPLSFLGSDVSNLYFGFRPLGASFGVAMSDGWVDPQDGEYVFVPTTRNFRDFVAFLRRLYQDGLLDQEAFTLEFPQYSAKGQSEVMGSMVGISGLLVLGAPVFEDWAALTPPRVEGYDIVYPVDIRGYATNEAYISSQATSPEIAMRWLGAYAEHENFVNLHLGEIGFCIESVGDITIDYVPVEGMTDQEARHARSPGISAPNLEYPGINNIFVPNPHSILIKEHMQAYLPYLDREYRTDPLLPPEISEELNELQVNIDNIVTQKIAEWVIEGGMDDEWTQFVNELENAGLERYMEIFEEYIPIAYLENFQP